VAAPRRKSRSWSRPAPKSRSSPRWAAKTLSLCSANAISSSRAKKSCSNPIQSSCIYSTLRRKKDCPLESSSTIAVRRSATNGGSLAAQEISPELSYSSWFRQRRKLLFPDLLAIDAFPRSQEKKRACMNQPRLRDTDCLIRRPLEPPETAWDDRAA